MARANPSVPWVAPFVVYIAFLSLGKLTGLPPEWLVAARFACVLALLLTLSRPVISLRATKPVASVGIGIAVFLIWIGPDTLWPSYRTHWLFENSITGTAAASIPVELRANVFYVALRAVGSAALVPILEELFWRGWLMRWLIDRDFRAIALGTYSAQSFWIVAALFASEHGSYWDVGLAAGVLYNWWMVRTRSLANCILAHAITNACLAVYVLLAGQWQFWP